VSASSAGSRVCRVGPLYLLCSTTDLATESWRAPRYTVVCTTLDRLYSRRRAVYRLQVRAQLCRALAFSKQQHDVPQSFHAVDSHSTASWELGRGSQQVTGEPFGFEY
jgi:hypothetical protein